MLESVIHLAPMLILGGLIAGWLAEAVSRAGGYGLIPDIALGLAGSAIAGAFVWLVIWREPGMSAMLLVGCAGAALAIVVQRGVWRSVPLAARGDGARA